MFHTMMPMSDDMGRSSTRSTMGRGWGRVDIWVDQGHKIPNGTRGVVGKDIDDVSGDERGEFTTVNENQVGIHVGR